MADVHFRVPYGLMNPYMYFGVPESKGKGVHRDDIHKVAF